MWVRVTINNWIKFNPRADRANYTWFRFENKFFDNQVLFGLPDSAVLTFIFLCCEASKKNAANLIFRIDFLAQNRKMSTEEVLKDLELLNAASPDGKLIDLQMVPEDRHDDGKEPSLLPATRHNITRHNETERDIAAAAAPAPSRGAPPEALMDIWNVHCGDLPKVTKLSAKRKLACKGRLKEEPDLDYWRKVVERIASSSFCNGNNNRNWRADFDFLLRPDTHVKAMEGKYDNRGGPGAPSAPRKFDAKTQAEFDEIARARAEEGLT